MSHDNPNCRYCLGTMEPDTDWSMGVQKYFFVCEGCRSRTPHGTSRESAAYLANHPAPGVAVPTPAPPATKCECGRGMGGLFSVSIALDGHALFQSTSKTTVCGDCLDKIKKQLSSGSARELLMPPALPDPSPEARKLLCEFREALADTYKGAVNDAAFGRLNAAEAALLAEFTRLDKLAQHYHNEASAGWTKFREAEREIAALRPTPSPQGRECWVLWRGKVALDLRTYESFTGPAGHGEKWVRMVDASTPSETLTAPVDEMAPIPVAAGERIAKEFGYDQVIIVARKVGDGGGEHLTTYGRSKEHCDVAARAGDFLKYEVMKWVKAAPTKAPGTATPPARPARNLEIIPTDAVPPGTIAMIQDGKITGMITNLAPEPPPLPDTLEAK